MSVRETIQIGHPALKAKNTTVKDWQDPHVKQVIADLKETMQKEGLIGMAAPQIAENIKIFVTEPRKTPTRADTASDGFRVYINPKIIATSAKESVIYEGCGSVLHGQLFGPVSRPAEITVEAFDENGEKFNLTCNGILARVIQHEYDHLQGIEFLEKVTDLRKIIAAEFYIKDIRNSEATKRASKITKLSRLVNMRQDQTRQ